MVVVDTLLNSSRNKKVGNHQIIIEGEVQRFIYHYTTIFMLDHRNKKIVLNNGGWGTSSTTRAINSYMRHRITQSYLDKGYAVEDRRNG